MVDWCKTSYTQEELRIAWESCKNVSRVCKFLGISTSGSSMRTVRAAASELGLEQKGHVAEKRPRRTLEEDLIENSLSRGNELKKKLWAFDLLPRRCFCGIQDTRLLTLDHINGVNSDNRIENLRILCYNCHALTDTFGSKNKKRK